MKDPSRADSDISAIMSFKTIAKPRCLIFWDERKELFIGHSGGILAVYQLESQELLNKGPLCTFNF